MSNFIPARYIQDIKVRYGDELVLSIDSDISLSEDPVITFGLHLHGEGPLRVDVQDSTSTKFHHEFALLNRS